MFIIKELYEQQREVTEQLREGEAARDVQFEGEAAKDYKVEVMVGMSVSKVSMPSV